MKFAVFGCKHTTNDLIDGLFTKGFHPELCVTLRPDLARKEKVAGYYHVGAIWGRECYYADTYKLNSQKDKKELRNELGKRGIEAALVLGWQRLLPKWLLDVLKKGAFGCHGASKPLPHGRGRSPMNWSLIQGKRQFFTHLFRYDTGADSGPIVDVKRFDISLWDDCHTLHLKNMLAMLEMCAHHLPDILKGEIIYRAQDNQGASYYPKRTEEDGLIHWENPCIEIFNLVRGVTKPFPGAFTFLPNRTKIRIWRAIPFDSWLINESVPPGTIVHVFYDKSFLVKTGDINLLVQKYEIMEHRANPITLNDVGTQLTNLGIPKKKWKNLPE